MQKIQVQTEIDFLTIFNDLATKDLELFAKEIAIILTKRKAREQRAKEADLLQKLNEECVLPDGHFERFYWLNQKKSTTPLSETERTELAQLIQEEEQLRLKRVKVLGKLARLKKMSIQQVSEQLALKAPEIV